MKNYVVIAPMILWSISLYSQEFKLSNSKFKDYWYSGKAEIASYELDISRYGENRTGNAVLIFVTEDFSRSKHVKLDRPQQVPEDKVNVMKLNFTKKFLTGIYPYSMMTSVFTPALSDPEMPLKITSSSQEWCGNTFMQMNLEDDQYLFRGFSYFEKEGDVKYKIDQAMPEDNIWNLIRIDPNLLPAGKIKLIPGTIPARLNHFKVEPENAVATLNVEEEEAVYTIDYPVLGRRLKITFESEFPFKITSWEETFKVVKEGKEKTFVTKARLLNTVHTDYWTKTGNEDIEWREKLKLPVIHQ